MNLPAHRLPYKTVVASSVSARAKQKRQRQFSLFLIAGLQLGIIFQSCSSTKDPCLEPTTVTLKVHTVRRADTGIAVQDTFLPSATWVAIGNKSALQGFRYTTRNDAFELNLSEGADSCKWSVQADSNLKLVDTITFYYDRQIKFLSTNCGYTTYYNLRQILTTRNAIDSVFTTNASITPNANTAYNLTILFYN